MTYGTNKTEQFLAKSIGAKSIKNSGRGRVKGDATWHNFLVDFKECGKSFTVNESVWAKVCSDALTHNGLDPALLVFMESGPRLAIIELDVLEELIERAG